MPARPEASEVKVVWAVPAGPGPMTQAQEGWVATEGMEAREATEAAVPEARA